MSYTRTKPASIDCELCGDTVSVKPGRGRKPRFCGECRNLKMSNVVDATPEPYVARSLADHPLAVGDGRARAHALFGGKVGPRKPAL